MATYSELMDESRELKTRLNDNYLLRKNMTVEKLVSDYGDRGIRVQNLMEEHGILIVHLPTHLSPHPKRPGQTQASTEINVVNAVERVARGTASAYDLKAIIDTQFVHGGIYVTKIGLEERIN